MSQRKKILFVSGFLPSMRVPSGGQKLAGRILDRISLESEVSLLAFCNENEILHLDQQDFKNCKTVKILQVDRTARIRGALFHPMIPLISSGRYLLGSRWFRKALIDEAPDLVWIEFMQAASLLQLVPMGIRTRLVVHDFFHQAHQRRAAQESGLAKKFWTWEARRTKLWEAKVLERASEVMTLTDKDMVIARELGRTGEIEVRYPEVDQIYHRLARSRGPLVIHGTILFWGQMSRKENEDGAVWFVRDIFPAILAARPHSRLIVAGAEPGPTILGLASEKVEVTGFVSDPMRIFQTAEIAVAPLRLGAGIKIKVAEFMAAEIPTVCTPIGAEGIRHSPLLRIASTAVHFAEECIALLKKS